MSTTVRPKTISITITTAGTPQQVVATKTLVRSLIFQADNNNAAIILVGDADMDANNSVQISAQNSFSVDGSIMGKAGADDIDLSDFWVDGQNNDLVRIMYLERV